MSYFSKGYHAILVDNKLYTNVKNQKKLVFNSDTTTDIEYYNNRECFLTFDKNDLSHLNLSYYDLGFNTSSASEINTFKILYNNDCFYHIGYTNSNNSINTNNHINFIQPSYLEVDGLKRNESKVHGHIFKIDNDYNMCSAITFYHNIPNSNCLVTDLICSNNHNFVCLTSGDITNNQQSLYFYKFDNETETQICNNDTYNEYNTSAIIKFSEDFQTPIWYDKFFASTKSNAIDNSNRINSYTWTNNKDLLTYTFENLNNYHIIENDKFIYNTVSIDKGADALFYTNGDIEKLTTLLNNEYYSFVVSKIKAENGNIEWSVPIYYNSDDIDNYITNFLYDDGDIYLTIKTNNNIIINDVVYGEDNNSWKIFIIKLNNEGEFMWVKEIGGKNDDYATDLKIYKTKDETILLLSGYYETPTVIGSYILSGVNHMNSYIIKIDPYNCDILSLYHKYNDGVIKITNMLVDGDELFVCGDFTRKLSFNMEYSDYSSYGDFFIEKIKIKNI